MSFISIHAPKRERLKALGKPCQSKNFNPRSQTGATVYPRRLRPRPGISIHAPKRERQKSNAPRAYIAFISIHAPKRERLTRQLLPELSPTFQSTLPNGSDHCELIRPPHKFYFNPRSQTGATGFLVKSGDVPVYFNPRSQTGATGCWGPSFFPYGSFQSTLPNGSDGKNA